MSNPNAKLLIVDDEPDLRDALASMVKTHLGAEVCLAENGQQALERLGTFEPDAVLSDIGMPVLNGLEFIREVRMRGIETPIVFLTAYADRKNMVEALRLGALDFLEKPMEEKMFLQVVERALRYGQEMKRMSAELNDFCDALPESDQAKLKGYRDARRAILLLKAEQALVRARKAC